ncbi:MAG TPA: FixH family protein [Sunxiuqinia sp.]|nr:FixH family protein [Sunxiuqinia sp.]
MKFKINWGTGIVIAMIVMISGMLLLIYIATRQSYSLVETNYYQKEIAYQEQIDKTRNANALKEKIALTQSKNNLMLKFPGLFQTDTVKGTIHLYCRVSDKNDLIVPIQLNNRLTQLVPIEKLPRGRYKVMVDWTAQQTPYYQELDIFLK